MRCAMIPCFPTITVKQRATMRSQLCLCEHDYGASITLGEQGTEGTFEPDRQLGIYLR